MKRSAGVLLAHEFHEGTHFGALQTARRVQNPKLHFIAGNALVRDAFPLQLPTVLGIELAGVVEAVGAGYRKTLSLSGVAASA